MNKAWLFGVEQVLLAATSRNERVMGFVSPQSSPHVDELSRMVAETQTLSGVRALLMDLSDSFDGTEVGGPWGSEASDLSLAIIRDNNGVDRIQARSTNWSRYLFNSVPKLRQALSEDLAGYERIVVQLPMIGHAANGGINPLGPAAACDAVYLVCEPNAISRDDLSEGARTLRSAGANITGVILVDSGQTSPREEIARTVETVFRFAPRLGAKLAQSIRASPLLG